VTFPVILSPRGIEDDKESLQRVDPVITIIASMTIHSSALLHAFLGMSSMPRNCDSLYTSI